MSLEAMFNNFEGLFAGVPTPKTPQPLLRDPDEDDCPAMHQLGDDAE